ncbi:MAG: branched-chain amino acid ABC transporter permease [Acidimicrobiia bacterium]|jgi:branched-chain amino acid transport system permease protein|nr:branched-chain amino acid ABC transporter permease [Acidimicrobiia bacterium]
MTEFIQALVGGVALGSIYALVALGFVVIYRATGIINFSQGAIVTLGAYLTFNAAQTWGLPFAIAAIVAIAGCALLGVFIERFLLRWFVGQPVLAVIMVTIGLLNILDQLIKEIWGVSPVVMGEPWRFKNVTVGSIVIPWNDIITLAVTTALVTLFFFTMQRSRIGLGMRAVAIDTEAALANGISANAMNAAAWAMSGGIAAIAGIMLAGDLSNANPNMGFIALAAFPAMILGGLDSPVGAVFGGIIIGLTEVMTKIYINPWATKPPQWLENLVGTPTILENVHQVTPYIVMVLILLIRPQGLFGTKEVERV